MHLTLNYNQWERAGHSIFVINQLTNLDLEVFESLFFLQMFSVRIGAGIKAWQTRYDSCSLEWSRTLHLSPMYSWCLCAASSHFLFHWGSEVLKRSEHTNAANLRNKTKERKKTGLVHNPRCIYAIRRHLNLLVQVTAQKTKQLVKTLPEAEVSNSVPGLVHAWATLLNEAMMAAMPGGWRGSTLSSARAPRPPPALAQIIVPAALCAHPKPCSHQPSSWETAPEELGASDTASQGAAQLLHFPKRLQILSWATRHWENQQLPSQEWIFHVLDF